MTRPGRAAGAAPSPLVLVVVLGVLAAVLAVAAGLLWHVTAPLPDVTVLTGGGASYATPQDPAFIAADGWFVLLTGVVGVACGVALRLLARSPVPWHPVLLAGVCLAAATLTLRVGTALGPGPLGPRVEALRTGGTLQGPLQLRSTVALVAAPLAGVLAYAATTAAASRRHRPARTG